MLRPAKNQSRTPILNKREVKKYRNVANIDPKRTLYLRIPPPTERSIMGLSPFLLIKPKVKPYTDKKNLQLAAESDSSDDVANIDDSSSEGDERQSRHQGII